MEEPTKEKQLIQWHPAFYAGLQIEFEEEWEKIIFEEEHQLTKKPLEIDVIIIKKKSKETIQKNIGRIFRKHNIIEYKSPDDSLNIDVFYKVWGYACLYKSDAPHVDDIKSNEITISYVCGKMPRELFRHLLEERKAEIIKADDGIYYIQGLYFPTQIIVTSKLSLEENFWLGNLTNRLKEANRARRLLLEYRKHKNEDLYKAMMNVIIRANNELFKEEDGMCEAMLEIVEDRIIAREQKAEARGQEIGELRGERKTLLKLMQEGILTISDVASRLNLSEQEVRNLL